VILKYLNLVIVSLCNNIDFYTIEFNEYNMLSRVLKTEIKWIILALIITFFLVGSINRSVLNITEIGVSKTFLGLNLFLEILVFFAFSTFVVFGIKGFFEMYSRKAANAIIFVSGVFLAVIIFILSYQILTI
jgi:hypothetical protein